MDIFIGGGGDDLSFLNLGVMADYARGYAAETGRGVAYVPNARPARVRALIRDACGNQQDVNLIGHSWGACDAWRSAAWAARRGLPIKCLITLDAVAGPMRNRFEDWTPAPWLDVAARPAEPDRSDRLTTLRPWARKPSGLPVSRALRHVTVEANHWNVDAMMRLSGARTWLDVGPPWVGAT